MTANREKLVPKPMKVIPVFVLAFGLVAFFFLDLDRYFSLAALTDNHDFLLGLPTVIESDRFLVLPIPLFDPNWIAFASPI